MWTSRDGLDWERAYLDRSLFGSELAGVMAYDRVIYVAGPVGGEGAVWARLINDRFGGCVDMDG